MVQRIILVAIILVLLILGNMKMGILLQQRKTIWHGFWGATKKIERQKTSYIPKVKGRWHAHSSLSADWSNCGYRLFVVRKLSYDISAKVIGITK